MAHKIIEVLRLPRGVVPVTTVTLGWPAEYPEQPDRLPAEAIVHREVYTDYTDQEIRRFYSAKEAREDSASLSGRITKLHWLRFLQM